MKGCVLLVPMFNGLTILSCIALVGALHFFFRGFRLLARKRLVLNTPTSKIRGAPMGLVEVSGLATGPHTMPSPITGQACYLCHTIAWQRRESGKSDDWEKVAEETLSLPFFLDDNTGQLLVDPAGAELDLHRDFRQQYSTSFFSTREDIPVRVRDFLVRHGVTPARSIRVEERCIKPKNALFIVGTQMESQTREWPSNPATLGVRKPARTVLTRHTLTPAEQVVRLSDAPCEQASADLTLQGKIAAALNRAAQVTNPSAWASAGLPEGFLAVPPDPQAERPTAAAEKQASADSPTLQKGANDSTFLISWRSRQAVLRSFTWKSIAMIWGGGALVLLAIYVLLAQMELL